MTTARSDSPIRAREIVRAAFTTYRREPVRIAMSAVVVYRHRRPADHHREPPRPRRVRVFGALIASVVGLFEVHLATRLAERDPIGRVAAHGSEEPPAPI